MRRAQIVAYGVEGRLADLLQETAQGRALWLRPVRHVKTCTNLLRQGAGVLVLQLGKNVDQEVALLAQATRLFPLVRTLAIAPNVALAGLCWDLGAAYVLAPPLPIETLGEVVLGLAAPDSGGLAFTHG
jgi:hypothetical protein